MIPLDTPNGTTVLIQNPPRKERVTIEGRDGDNFAIRYAEGAQETVGASQLFPDAPTNGERTTKALKFLQDFNKASDTNDLEDVNKFLEGITDASDLLVCLDCAAEFTQFLKSIVAFKAIGQQIGPV